MTFPLIKNIYEFRNQKVVIWQQDLFRKVYLRSIPENGGSHYTTANWWIFMFNAKFIDKVPEISNSY